ncbi:hypothetical protein Tco_1418515 [Tanacetum coccineum]
MSSITAQQTKLDLELVPKEKRLEIRKCNGRLNPRKKQRETTFQVILDALALTPCYSAFLITADVPKVYIYCVFLKELGHTREIKSIFDVVVDQMHQPWRTFATIINRSLSGKTTGLDKLRLFRAYFLLGMFYMKNVDYVELLWKDFAYQIDNRGHKKQDKMYYPRFTKVIIHYFLTKDKTVSKKNKIGMHTSRDDYLINTLRFVSANEESQIYGAQLPKSYGHNPKMQRNLKALQELYLGLCYRILVSPEEPTRKSKRVKRPAKKSTNAPTTCVVIRDTPIMSLFKKKEKVTVEKRKGIDLLSKVALTEEAQYEEVHKKRRDEDDNNNDHDLKSEGSDQESNSDDNNTQSDKEKGLDSEHETDENETGSESDQEENEEEVEDNEEEKDEEFVKTSSNSTDDEDETNIDDKAEGHEDKGMDYTVNQFNNDVDVRLNEPVNTDEGFIQKEGTDAEMINVQQGNENLETTLNQFIEDAHVTISTVPKKTEVPITSSSHSSDLASKYLNFLDIPHIDAEIISPIEVHAHHEIPSNQAPTLLTIPVSVITDSSLVYLTIILQSLPSFTPPPPQSTSTPPPKTKVTNPLSALLNFASVFQFNNRVRKRSIGTKKDDLLNTQVTALVDEHLDSRLGATRDDFMSYLSASITARITEQVKIQLPHILPKEVSNFAHPVIKSMVTESLEHAVLAKESSQPKSTYKAAALLTEFELKKTLIDKMDKSQSYMTATEHRECYDGLIKSYDLDNNLFSTYDKVYSLKRSRKDKDKDEEPFAGSDQRLKKRKTSKDVEPTKGLKTKESKSGSSKGTKSQSKSSGKSVQAEEPEFETPLQGPTQSWLMTLASSVDRPLKTFDEFMSTPIEFSRQQRKNFYEYARGFESGHDVYSTKRILAVTWVEVMQKHGYGYLREIKVRRDDNDLYTFKEGDFPRLRINDIKDMLVLIVQNKLTNLLGDDVFDFAIALQRFTRSIVIKKRVEDLQLGVKSYQKKITVTRPKATRPNIKKRDPYTPYQDPQGFIYVDNQGRNMLMRSDELYKFSDGTLTRLRTLLDDITKNIIMGYLPQRRWSSLENKRAHIMIKATYNQLKERRMIRRFEKFVGGRHYGTDLRLLQRTI